MSLSPNLFPSLVQVRSDEQTREYRDRMTAVNEYKMQHDIPKPLFESMTEHVELFFRCQVRDVIRLA